MCNCLRNLHVEYVKAVRPNGVALTPPQLLAENQSIADLRAAVRDKCFKSVRPTQVGFVFLVRTHTTHYTLTHTHKYPRRWRMRAETS